LFLEVLDEGNVVAVEDFASRSCSRGGMPSRVEHSRADKDTCLKKTSATLSLGQAISQL
jgi:hypothetical protein